MKYLSQIQICGIFDDFVYNYVSIARKSDVDEGGLFVYYVHVLYKFCTLQY